MFTFFPQIIAWNDMLLLLEGEPTHLPAPKTHYNRDILIQKDTPIFCTSSQEIRMVKGGVIIERETEMMAVRWKHFSFHSQVPADQQRHLLPCGHCFASLVLPPLPNTQSE
jgi:hypothetical protein